MHWQGGVRLHVHKTTEYQTARLHTAILPPSPAPIVSCAGNHCNKWKCVDKQYTRYGEEVKVCETRFVCEFVTTLWDTIDLAGGEAKREATVRG